jgi:hypothetical protein
MAQAQRKQTDPQSETFVARPYEVRVDGARRGAFEDLRDANSSARIAKRDRPLSRVAVSDCSTGQLVIEMDG